ncbi:MAG: CinA family protein [Marmoricola sp.]
MADLAARVHEALWRRGQTAACAESLTGGELAAALSRAPGASATFLGAVVSYATAVKQDLLGVTAERVVSVECATQMAAGVRRLLGADWAVSTTGVAGPERQEDQPVGTVYVGLAGPDGARAIALQLEGERHTIRASSCHEALRALLEALGDADG